MSYFVAKIVAGLFVPCVVVTYLVATDAKLTFLDIARPVPPNVAA